MQPTSVQSTPSRHATPQIPTSSHVLPAEWKALIPETNSHFHNYAMTISLSQHTVWDLKDSASWAKARLPCSAAMCHRENPGKDVLKGFNSVQVGMQLNLTRTAHHYMVSGLRSLSHFHSPCWKLWMQIGVCWELQSPFANRRDSSTATRSPAQAAANILSLEACCSSSCSLKPMNFDAMTKFTNKMMRNMWICYSYKMFEE